MKLKNNILNSLLAVAFFSCDLPGRVCHYRAKADLLRQQEAVKTSSTLPSAEITDHKSIS